MIPTPAVRTTRLSEENIAMATAWRANAIRSMSWYRGMRRILEYAMEVNTWVRPMNARMIPQTVMLSPMEVMMSERFAETMNIRNISMKMDA